jgi:hypothetical protein
MRPNGKKFFRTQSPRHFEGGDWNEGGSCQRDKPLSAQEVLKLQCIKYLDSSFSFSLAFFSFISLFISNDAYYSYMHLYQFSYFQVSLGSLTPGNRRTT